MIIPALNDIAFKIFGFPIYWYGIIMAVSMFVSIITANILSNRIFEKKNLFIEYSPLILISGIVGARLYFCVLNFSFYTHNIIEILNFREGGLSIHGGILGGILALIYITKRENISFLKILDTASVGIILGQSIGRWGNYFNCEAYGIPTKFQNWGLYIPVEHRIKQFMDYSLYHPAFLYESVLDFLAFILLIILFVKLEKKHKGVVFFSYLFIYSVIRFFIEGIRVDSALSINSVHFPQIVSVILIIVAIAGFFHCYQKSFNNFPR